MEAHATWSFISWYILGNVINWKKKKDRKAVLTNDVLSQLAQILDSCYQEQVRLPLKFRKYLMAYYSSGQTEYIALREAACLRNKPDMDGFASTWLDGETENRVWIGADGAIENRGPSTEAVRWILKQMVQALRDGKNTIAL